MICVSMNTSLGSMGGFCAGKSFIIDHQRLSGLGYCFSASLPPLLTTSAMEALSIMDTSPQLFEQLRDNARKMREFLAGQVSSLCKVPCHRIDERGEGETLAVLFMMKNFMLI